MLVFPIWDVVVECAEEEYGRFTPPAGQTCGAYMESFLATGTGYIQDPVSALCLSPSIVGVG